MRVFLCLLACASASRLAQSALRFRGGETDLSALDLSKVAKMPPPKPPKTSGKVTFYLVRHGETYWNARDMLQGQTDTELNEKGHQQAAEVGEGLSKYKVDAIVSSPLQRTRDTAAAIRIHHPRATYHELHLLKEHHGGKFQGLIQAGEDCEIPAELDRLYGDWQAGKMNSRYPGSNGESPQDVLDRTMVALADASQMGDSVLLVLHGRVLRWLALHVCGLSYADRKKLGAIRNCAVSTLEYDRATGELKPIRLFENMVTGAKDDTG